MQHQDLQKNQNYIESQQYLVQSDLDSTLAEYKLDQAESVITYGTHLFTVVGIFIAIAAFVLTGVSIRNFILGKKQRREHEKEMLHLKKQIDDLKIDLDNILKQAINNLKEIDDSKKTWTDILDVSTKGMKEINDAVTEINQLYPLLKEMNQKKESTQSTDKTFPDILQPFQNLQSNLNNISKTLTGFNTNISNLEKSFRPQAMQELLDKYKNNK